MPELCRYHDDAVRAARFFQNAGITTIGVCFLHSYADPSHAYTKTNTYSNTDTDSLTKPDVCS